MRCFRYERESHFKQELHNVVGTEFIYTSICSNELQSFHMHVYNWKLLLFCTFRLKFNNIQISFTIYFYTATKSENKYSFIFNMLQSTIKQQKQLYCQPNFFLTQTKNVKYNPVIKITLIICDMYHYKPLFFHNKKKLSLLNFVQKKNILIVTKIKKI